MRVGPRWYSVTPIYLDYNATTPVDPTVADTIVPLLREHYGNPSSSHALGKVCRDAVDKARQQVASLVGASPDEIFFTAGGTESNNLVIQGTFLKEGNRTAGMVTSCFEHPAVRNPALFHRENGGEVSFVKTDSSGVIDLDELKQVLNDRTRLVSVMHANNEIGTLQPIRELSEICSLRGIPLHTDAAQSVGKVPVRVDDLGVDFLTIAGHKLYAPKGVGALYIRRGQKLLPAIHGANHENGVRPGTENVPYIAGLGAAAQLVMEQGKEKEKQLQNLRDRLEKHLAEQIGNGISFNGCLAERLPNTSSVNFPGVEATRLLAEIPGLCVSTGAACHSDSIRLSDTLKAIGIDEQTGAGTVRISCGRFTTDEEVDRAGNLLVKAWEACRQVK